MEPLIFSLGSRVKLPESGETGTVIGRAEYSEANPQYLVRYKAADGRQVEGWWSQNAVTTA